MKKNEVRDCAGSNENWLNSKVNSEMKISERLLMIRGGKSSNNYCCPVYLSTEACRQLFQEAGIEPDPKCVGMLGDVLENFSLMLLENWDGKSMTTSQFSEKVAELLD